MLSHFFSAAEQFFFHNLLEMGITMMPHKCLIAVLKPLSCLQKAQSYQQYSLPGCEKELAMGFSLYRNVSEEKTKAKEKGV